MALKEFVNQPGFWMMATLTVILLGWVQYLRFNMKLHILRHKLTLHQVDLKIARKYLLNHPQDFAAYKDEVIKAIDELP